MPQPSPVLSERREAVSRLVMRWDDALADSVAAVNLFLDLSRDRRKAAIAELLDRVGPCQRGSRVRCRRERTARSVDDAV